MNIHRILLFCFLVLSAGIVSPRPQRKNGSLVDAPQAARNQSDEQKEDTAEAAAQEESTVTEPTTSEESDQATPTEEPTAQPTETKEIPQEETPQKPTPGQAKSSEQHTEKFMKRHAFTVEEEEVIQEEPAVKKHVAYLGEYLEPWEHGPSQERVEFLFENAELSVLLQYVEQKFNVTFLLDDSIQPLPQGGKSIMGSKISFRTHHPLSKKDAWNLFVAFLDMAGLSPAPGPGKNVYRLLPSQDNKSPQSITRAALPTFIGVDPALIPNNDTRIRYVYFVANAGFDVIKNVLDSMKSVSAPVLMTMPELNAIIITDKASNIKAMLAVVKELDQANMPEALAVIKLQRTDASKAAALYESLIKKKADEQTLAARLLGARRQPSVEYFSEGTRVIPEPRTNSLIVLGSRESIKKIADFMVTIVDKQEMLPEMPLYVYRIKFLDAESVAKILNGVTKFQPKSPASKVGGVREGDKYFKPLTVTAEKTTNSLIINADYEDYSKIYDLLQQIDTEQPQVAIKVFIINVDLTDSKAFGIQMRNKIPGVSGLIGKDTNFQTSGLADADTGIVENPSGTGATRLLGDLVSLASSVHLGSTIVSLGSDRFGVWGMLNMLETYTRAKIVANPFLVTTHKYPAQFSIGQSRYVVTSRVFSTSGPQDTFDYVDANLSVSITPQVSRDNLVKLDVKVYFDQFVEPDINSTNGDTFNKRLTTSVILADNEVLALGGLVRETTNSFTSSVPILGSIPILGWLFKNKFKTVERNSLLILIVPEIILPQSREVANMFTKSKLLDAQDLSKSLQNATDLRDPVHRWFFKDQYNQESKFMDSFAATKGKYTLQTVTGEFEPSQSTTTLGDVIKSPVGQEIVVNEKTPTYKLKRRSLVDMLPEA